MEIPITGLVQSIQGGNPSFQVTRVHPQVATHLAQWASPKFAVLAERTPEESRRECLLEWKLRNEKATKKPKHR